MLTVELIYDTDCPNVEEARRQLLRAFAEAGLGPQWQEWDRSAPESPSYARGYGSPTILVDGQDVADVPSSAEADCCRVYADKSGRLRGIPSAEAITSAFLRAKGMGSATGAAAMPRSSWRRDLAVLPGVGAALLPNLACPACWPAYAGLLSALGLGFIDYTPYLLPLTVLFMGLAVVSLGYRAKICRGYTPFFLGILASAIVIIGKFVLFSDLAVYGGIALLIGTSLWNSWPQQVTEGGPCPACVSTGPLTQKRG